MTSFKSEDKDNNISKEYQYDHIRFGLRINKESKGFMNSNVKFHNLGIVVDKPFKFQNMQILIRCIHTTYDRYTKPFEYSELMVVGGVLDVTIYKYLEQPNIVKNWKMK